MNTPQATYTLEDVGCYVDGVRGIYATDAIVEFAENHGFDLNDTDPQNPMPESFSEDCQLTADVEYEVDNFMNGSFAVDGASWGRADVRPTFTEQIIQRADDILADAAVQRWNEGRE